MRCWRGNLPGVGLHSEHPLHQLRTLLRALGIGRGRRGPQLIDTARRGRQQQLRLVELAREPRALNT
jgi:hypothetical protein